MTLEIKPLESPDWRKLISILNASFGWAKTERAFEPIRQVFEFDRSLAAYEGPDVAATMGVWSLDRLSVPGGASPSSGLTMCAVAPTRQGQGLFRQMMTRQLADMRARGEALTVLFAEEGSVYGSYGYGPAVYGSALAIKKRHAQLLDGLPPAAGTLHLVSRDEAIRDWAAVDEALLAETPGMNDNRKAQWAVESLIWGEGGGARSERFYLECRNAGVVEGYACYQTEYRRAFGGTNSVVHIDSLMAISDDAYRALWNYFFGLGLIDEISVARRPVWEPLVWMLRDPQQLSRRVYNTMWVRLLDVAKALEARSYLVDDRLVLEVSDALCADDRRVLELDASRSGARCVSTTKTPDISLSIADLSVLHMGGVDAVMLLRAGRIEGSIEAARRLDAIFRWRDAPWSPRSF